MFPCPRGHYNAGCDKSDNDLSPPPRAILGRVGLGKTGYIPLFWFSGSRVGAEGFLKVLPSVSLTMLCDFRSTVRVTGCVRRQIFQLDPVLFGTWFRGFRGFEHQVAADALNFLTAPEQSQDGLRTTNTLNLKPVRGQRAGQEKLKEKPEVMRGLIFQTN